MPRPIRRRVALLCLFAVLAPAATAQQTATDYAWKPLLTHEGVEFTYIYYAKPGSVADGVVVKVANTNDYAVRYRFKIVFRTTDAERIEEAEGVLAPREVSTGDLDGLYWVPFEDGRPIVELGMRGFRVTRQDAAAPGPFRTPASR